ncbi:hypothetical protein DPMN_053171 [Dreissena polymorpha]|uniref:Uncharacterized protein n=1 Tax=Dreissena polymorpha TaxID=45954 RepID=A0A9D4HQF1_DREPO|nr:hypothetical protein DPMN_053171 [Dreissena polymorpha]
MSVVSSLDITALYLYVLTEQLEFSAFKFARTQVDSINFIMGTEVTFHPTPQAHKNYVVLPTRPEANLGFARKCQTSSREMTDNRRIGVKLQHLSSEYPVTKMKLYSIMVTNLAG